MAICLLGFLELRFLALLTLGFFFFFFLTSKAFGSGVSVSGVDGLISCVFPKPLESVETLLEVVRAGLGNFKPLIAD